jgi:hypothetical protein
MAGKIGSYAREHHLALLCLCLVIGGGTAWAAGLAPNSVKSKHIKDGQVKAADLGDGAIDSTKIADDGIFAAKIDGLESLRAKSRAFNDPSLNGLPISELFAFGDFSLRFLCNEDPEGTFTAEIEILGPSSMSVDSNGENSDNATGTGSGATLLAVGPTTSPNVRNGSFGAIADAGETSLTGEVIAGTEIQGSDCAFAVSAAG